MIEVSRKQKDLLNKAYIMVTKRENIDFDYIIFKNFYVASIDIEIFINEGFKTILEDYVLMPNPNVDEGAEKYFVISKKDTKFNEINPNNSNVSTIKIILKQNSTLWKDYYLTKIEFIKEGTKGNNDNFVFENEPRLLYKIKNTNTTFIQDKDSINAIYGNLAKKGNSEVTGTLNVFS